MAKFIKPFKGVPDGEIYPKKFEAGDECPPELEAGALELGALELEAGALELGALEDSEEKKTASAKK